MNQKQFKARFSNAIIAINNLKVNHQDWVVALDTEADSYIIFDPIAPDDWIAAVAVSKAYDAERVANLFATCFQLLLGAAATMKNLDSEKEEMYDWFEHIGAFLAVMSGTKSESEKTVKFISDLIFSGGDDE